MLVSVFAIYVTGFSRAAEPGPVVDSAAVKAGVAAYDALEYERALALLDSALRESLTRDEKIVALRTLAFSAFALGREPDTRAAFERLLRVDPSHQLDRRQTPRLRTLLEEARTTLATRPKPQVTSGALPSLRVEAEPQAAREGKPLLLRVREPRGEAPLFTVFHRSGRQREFSRVETRRSAGGLYQAEIPGASITAPSFEYYALLLDGAGVPVAAAGTLGDPLFLSVARTPRPLYKKGWFWGTLGGVAAAGVVATVLALTLTPAPPAQVTIQPH
jgi:hypothetical protein